MDSALSPREIQSRIRSGATVEEVAVEAGVGVDQVEPFAVPVLAELDHIIEVAMTCPVRRAGAPGSHSADQASPADASAPGGHPGAGVGAG